MSARFDKRLVCCTRGHASPPDGKGGEAVNGVPGVRKLGERVVTLRPVPEGPLRVRVTAFSPEITLRNNGVKFS